MAGSANLNVQIFNVKFMVGAIAYAYINTNFLYYLNQYEFPQSIIYIIKFLQLEYLYSCTTWYIGIVLMCTYC